jgi:hypothetical protein
MAFMNTSAGLETELFSIRNRFMRGDGIELGPWRILVASRYGFLIGRDLTTAEKSKDQPSLAFVA